MVYYVGITLIQVSCLLEGLFFKRVMRDQK